MASSRGAALITALFIMALTAMIAVAIAVHQRLLITQTELMVRGNQLELDLAGVQDWAISNILSNLSKTKTSSGVLKSARFPTMNFHHVVLTGYLSDAQGRFNLNNLKATVNQPSLDRLLLALGLRGPDNLAAEVSNWVGGGVTQMDAAYLKQHPPYLVPHQLMQSVSSLRAIIGVSAHLYLHLRPYIVALPISNSMVNVNTASLPVLNAVLGGKGEAGMGQRIIACRGSLGVIQSERQLIACDPHISTDELSTIGYTTHYFLLFASASIGQQHVLMTSLLRLYEQSNGQPGVSVVWQQFV